MKEQVLLIINPNAGKGRIQSKIQKIKEHLIKEGNNVELAFTEKKMSVKSIIEKYNHPIDIIICCGGDGTINELVNALMQLENKPLMSFIPLGTVNDFAKTLGLSKRKFFKKNLLNEYSKQRVDIGKFNNKYFNYVTAFGAFTEVSYVTSQKLKKLLGKVAYFIVGIKYAFKIRSRKINLKINDEKFDEQCIYGSISNAKSIGGFQWFRKRDIAIDDGEFEVVLIKKPKYNLQYINIIFDILLKRYESKYFFHKKGSNIEISSEKKLTWTIDGEYGGRTNVAKIEVKKQALTFVIPK